MLIWFAMAMLVVAIVQFGVRYAQAFVVQVMGQRILHDLRMGLFAHVQSLPIEFFQRQPVGRLVTRLTNDVNRLNEMFAAAVVPVLLNTMILVGVIITMVMIDWRMGLVAVAVIPVTGVTVFVLQRWLRGHLRAERKALSAINAYLAEQVAGMREVQLFGRERRDRAQFRRLNNTHYRHFTRGLHVDALFEPFVSMLSMLTLAVVIWYATGAALESWMSLGELFLFVQLIRYFFQPIENLAQQANVIQAAFSSAERIFDLMDTKDTMPPPANPRDHELDAREAKHGKAGGHVRFEGVHFRYRADDPILRGIDIEAKPGEHIALVGATGAGKSTCIHLLSRFYDVDQGRVLLDGIDLRELTPQAVRSRVAVVHQDVFCFADTVARNISLGNDAIPRERVLACAEAVHADRFIARLPQGYDTQLTEGGRTLSLGERQLMAFARALAADPSVLVLDEATSNIDTPTEALIQEAMRTLIAGRTAVIIAHRLSTIRECDRIYVLGAGEVLERGTHDELLANGGHYAALHEQQFAPTLREDATA